MKWSLKVSSKSLRLNREENIFFQLIREFSMKFLFFILLIVAIIVIPFKDIYSSILHKLITKINYPIEKIEVSGNHYVDIESIIESSSLDYSQNIFDFDKEKISELILKNPLIKNVEIFRKLPGIVMLKIEEKQPEFYIFYNKNEMVLTADYEIIKADLPNKILDLPIMQFDLSLKAEIKELNTFFASKKDILEGIKTHFDKDMSNISEIFFSKNFSKLYLTNNQVITFNNFNENKFFIAKEILKDNNIDNVDLRFKDQIITYNN